MNIKLEKELMDWSRLAMTSTSGTEMSPEILEKMGWVKSTKYVENKYEQPCAIIEFCRKNPNVTSVCMTCTCPRCTTTCSTW